MGCLLTTGPVRTQGVHAAATKQSPWPFFILDKQPRRHVEQEFYGHSSLHPYRGSQKAADSGVFGNFFRRLNR